MTDELPMRPHATEPLSLTPDQKAKAQAYIRKIVDSISFLPEQFSPEKDDSIEARECVDNILGIAEYALADLSKTVGYDGRLKQEEESRHAGIRLANAKVRELEGLLAEGKEITGTGVLIDRVEKSVRAWWGSYGFSQPCQFHHGSYGVKFELRPSIELREDFEYVDDPVTRKNKKQMMLSLHESKGLTFLKPKYSGDGTFEAIDTPAGRTYLLELIAETFPGVSFHIVKSRAQDGGAFSIEQVEVFVRYIKLGDLEKYVPKKDEQGS